VSFGFLLYVWADGVYLQARVEETAECMLVLIGATLEGKKELVGFQAGVRESAQSWRELLIDIKRRGLEIAPDLAIGDGALGSGRPSMRSFPAPGTSGVGFTRPPTCSTRSPSSPLSTGTICARQTRSRSVFATVCHRTVRTKGSLSATTAKLMVFKLVSAAAKTWRRLRGENQLPKVVQGVRFQNGIEVIEMQVHHAA
jgi:putative transposase